MRNSIKRREGKWRLESKRGDESGGDAAGCEATDMGAASLNNTRRPIPFGDISQPCAAGAFAP
jgi:hypothetical protein